jgi:hypothetical protein
MIIDLADQLPVQPDGEVGSSDLALIDGFVAYGLDNFEGTFGGTYQETNQYTSARPRARNTHGQTKGSWPHWSWGRQAMTDDIFGGLSPKGNMVWVPTALPALATTLLELSMVLIPIRKLFTLLRGTCLASPLSQLQQINDRTFSITSSCAPQSSQSTLSWN